MGKEKIEIEGVNVEELIKLLNRAYADGWLAYYQFWIGAKIA